MRWRTATALAVQTIEKDLISREVAPSDGPFPPPGGAAPGVPPGGRASGRAVRGRLRLTVLPATSTRQSGTGGMGHYPCISPPSFTTTGRHAIVLGTSGTSAPYCLVRDGHVWQLSEDTRLVWNEQVPGRPPDGRRASTPLKRHHYRALGLGFRGRTPGRRESGSETAPAGDRFLPSARDGLSNLIDKRRESATRARPSRTLGQGNRKILIPLRRIPAAGTNNITVGLRASAVRITKPPGVP